MDYLTCAVFDMGTGKIRFIFTGHEEDLSAYASEGLGFVECDESVDDYSHWVSQTKGKVQIKERAPLDISHTSNGLKLTFGSLPPGVSVTVSGESVTTDGSDTEIEFELPGTYTIKLSGPVEYRDEVLEVTVG